MHTFKVDTGLHSKASRSVRGHVLARRGLRARRVLGTAHVDELRAQARTCCSEHRQEDIMSEDAVAPADNGEHEQDGKPARSAAHRECAQRLQTGPCPVECCADT